MLLSNKEVYILLIITVFYFALFSYISYVNYIVSVHLSYSKRDEATCNGTTMENETVRYTMIDMFKNVINPNRPYIDYLFSAYIIVLVIAVLIPMIKPMILKYFYPLEPQLTYFDVYKIYLASSIYGSFIILITVFVIILYSSFNNIYNFEECNKAIDSYDKMYAMVLSVLTPTDPDDKTPALDRMNDNLARNVINRKMSRDYQNYDEAKYDLSQMDPHTLATYLVYSHIANTNDTTSLVNPSDRLLSLTSFDSLTPYQQKVAIYTMQHIPDDEVIPGLGITYNAHINNYIKNNNSDINIILNRLSSLSNEISNQDTINKLKNSLTISNSSVPPEIIKKYVNYLLVKNKDRINEINKKLNNSTLSTLQEKNERATILSRIIKIDVDNPLYKTNAIDNYTKDVQQTFIDKVKTMWLYIATSGLLIFYMFVHAICMYSRFSRLYLIVGVFIVLVITIFFIITTNSSTGV